MGEKIYTLCMFILFKRETPLKTQMWGIFLVKSIFLEKIIRWHKYLIATLWAVINFWWQEMFKKYNNISMDEYIMMPNHVHGIISVVGAGPARPFTKYTKSNNLSTIIGSYKSSVTRQIGILMEIT
ncbi:MAG: hypothetical protein NG737_07055 [Omnitrophica bacterium]|nr:hypothetical protein [Candidatus Omnitrophota bacterium]